MTNRKIAGVFAIAAAIAAAPAVCQVAAASQADPIRTIPAVIDPDAKAAVAGINAFSVDLYRRTLTVDENHLLSPASVSVAMALAYRGARGATATELEQALHFGKPPREYLRVNAQILATMTFAGPQRELRTANALWLQDRMPLAPDYEQDLATFASAGLHRANFREGADAARLKVNDWVADSTQDKIKDLLLPDDVTKDTRAILINAIYWKGGWASVFDKKQTKPEPFTLLNGAQVFIPMMFQRSNFRVMEQAGIKAIMLPYIGNEVEMVVFLPNSAKGLPEFEEKLTANALAKWLNELSRVKGRETVLTMPRIRIESRQDLKNSLQAMGAPTAFSRRADFSGMATFPYAGEDPEAIGLNIERVIHKTYLDVDEIGSEAAAATAVVMEVIVTGTRREPPAPFIFRADKPFLFLLRDRRTGLILFMGRYVKP